MRCGIGLLVLLACVGASCGCAEPAPVEAPAEAPAPAEAFEGGYPLWERFEDYDDFTETRGGMIFFLFGRSAMYVRWTDCSVPSGPITGATIAGNRPTNRPSSW